MNSLHIICGQRQSYSRKFGLKSVHDLCYNAVLKSTNRKTGQKFEQVIV